MENNPSVLGFGDLVGKRVRINRGGPEAKSGRLLAVKPDHLVLQTDEEGMVYYRLNHIKSISTDSKDFSDLESEPVKVPAPFADAANFEELLQNMKSGYVQINRGGPESIQGYLVNSSDGHILLIANHEVVRIFTSHVQNISYATKRSQPTSTDQAGAGQSAANDGSNAEQSKQPSDERKTADEANKNSQSNVVLLASIRPNGNSRTILRRHRRKRGIKTKRKSGTCPVPGNRENQRAMFSMKYTGPQRAAANSFSNLWFSGMVKAGRIRV